MAEWVLVEDNKVKECHDLLPQNWNNISGLNLSSDNTEFLNSLGWFKVTKNTIYHNPENQKITGYDYQIVGNQVLESPIIQNISQQDIERSKQDNLRDFLRDLRSERDKRLRETDFTQLNDVITNFSDEINQKWKKYRQELRDLPSLFEEPGPINWPLKPGENNYVINFINDSFLANYTESLRGSESELASNLNTTNSN